MRKRKQKKKKTMGKMKEGPQLTITLQEIIIYPLPRQCITIMLFPYICVLNINGR